MDLILGLFAVAVAAGFIDSIAGGGGLLTVPALALAGFDPLTAVATNKLQGSFGSGSATLAFARAGRIDLKTMWPIAVAAMSGALIGAFTLTYIPRDAATIALPFLLAAVALYFLVSPRISDLDVHQRIPRPWFIATIVPLVGFYDGVFGPGAGSFYTIGFVSLLGFGLLKATAHTKLANFASNIAGLLVLALSGHIVWGVGIAMGVGQFVGARIGVWMTIRHGTRLVRPLLITVCCVLAVRLSIAPTHPIGAWLLAHGMI
ncbi:TSUP family transporter [Lichenihabitans psoromatis]|uniref:TSUP family transporter n=1 Tax=Lichenihabitans psoromatis TaxID=2528642 RepID=UPI0010383B3E|nr:TSUP family transporter [Lichenihabitans psoromatis]